MMVELGDMTVYIGDPIFYPLLGIETNQTGAAPCFIGSIQNENVRVYPGDPAELKFRIHGRLNQHVVGRVKWGAYTSRQFPIHKAQFGNTKYEKNMTIIIPNPFTKLSAPVYLTIWYADGTPVTSRRIFYK